MKPSRFLLFALALGWSAGGLSAQQPQPDPFAPAPAPGKAPAPAAVDPFQRDTSAPEPSEADRLPSSILIRFEVFSIDRKEGTALLRKKLSDLALYNELVARSDKKQAALDTLIVSRCRSGERAIVEGTSEYIYPTLYLHGNGKVPTAPTPPRGTPAPATPAPEPQVNLSAPAAPAGAFAPVLPTEFETRHTGWTLEVEPTIGGNDQVIDLRLSPIYTALAGLTSAGQGVSETQMPNFETQQLNTAATLYTGKPCLLSTFNKPPDSTLDNDSSEKLRFAYVTATIVHP